MHSVPRRRPRRPRVFTFGGMAVALRGKAWVSHDESVRRGSDGEVSHWRTAVAQSPEAAAPAECNDVISPG